MARVRKDLQGARYRGNRERFLDEWDGPCYWCRKATRDLELDHVIPVAAGIDPTDQSNWVAACKKCNAKRGAEQLAKMRAAKVQARARAMKNPAEFFGADIRRPRSPIDRISLDGQTAPDAGGAGLVAPDQDGAGQIAPRLETARLGGPTFGDAVGAWARQWLDLDFMPWQLHALQGQLEHDGEGNLIRRRSLVSVARQNGKTTALKALIGWALTEEPKRRGHPILVISTAHNLSLAAHVFETLAPLLRDEWNAKLRWSFGRMDALMPDGTRWLVQAATPSNFHGYSPTYIVADEIWNISHSVLFDGALPSQRAMRSPLFSCWSTAGTEDSHAMLQMREEGLRAIDQGTASDLYMAEWSVPPGIDVMSSPDSWPMANPAIGYTLEPAVLRDESRQMDKAAFMRASLNIWISSERSWLSPGLFDSLRVDAIPGGGVLAVESSIDEFLYCCVRAQRVGDDQIGVTVEFLAHSLAECWERTEAAAGTCDAVALTPSLFDLAPVSIANKKLRVGYAELATHTGTIRQLITEGRIIHTGERQLAEHVDRAVMVSGPRGYALSSKRSPGPITLARCMIFAAALIARPASNAKPAIAFSQ